MSESRSSLNFDREIRVGLVLYGGVSLAVYMNGVCREFYNAVRGRGIYRFIKAFTNADIVVDILSGTSAGGINGVLLSYALTNSQRLDDKKQLVDFARFADIWRNSGSISELLHKETTKASEIDSVLDGEGYYQTALEQGIDLTAGPVPSTELPEWRSQFKELDLFVTGTDVDGRVYTVLDNTKSAIEVKSHRVVFLLKHREGRKEPFNPDFETEKAPANHKGVIKALAKLCRITSCFPVAFPVVEVKIKDTDQSKRNVDVDEFADRKLVLWGQLDNRYIPDMQEVRQDGYSVYFVDGGVLDNRPFTYTINEMKYRVIERPIERKLFFLDPDPESFTGQNANIRTEKPGVIEVLFDSLSGLPSYESIANDLRLIESYNDNYARYKSMVDVISSFRHSRDRNGQGSLGPELDSGELSEQRVIYFRSRFLALRDRILPLVFNLEGTLDLGRDYETYRQDIHASAARLLVAGLDRVSESDLEDLRTPKAATQGGELYALFESIDSLDIEYFIRQHLYCLQSISDRFERHKKDANRQGFQSLLEAMGRQLKLLEVYKEIVERTLSRREVVIHFFSLLKPVVSGHESSQELEVNEIQLTQCIFQTLLGIHRFLFRVEHLDTTLNSILVTSCDCQTVSDSLAQQQLSKLLIHYETVVIPSTIQHLEDGRFSTGYVEDHVADNILTLISAQSLEIIENSDLGIWNSPENWTGGNASQSGQISERLAREFAAFKSCIDLPLYPLEYLSGMSTGAAIELIRISPDDAKLGYSPEFQKRNRDNQRSKLAGEQLGAFGGFFKRSWRSNDILWGRLDGVNRIVDGLITVEGIAHFREFVEENMGYLVPEGTVDGDSAVRDPAVRDPALDYWTAAVDRLLELSIPSRVDETDVNGSRIPDCDRPLQPETLQEWRDNYQTLKTTAIALLRTEVPRSARELEDLVATVREMLVFFGQFEIVQTDLPNVIQDAIQQQIQWAQQRSPQSTGESLQKPIQKTFKTLSGIFRDSLGSDPKRPSRSKRDRDIRTTDAEDKDPLRPTYQAVDGYFDQLVTPLAAARLAEDSLMRDPKFDLHQFFKGGKYSVGLETLTEDMPRSVLDDLAIQGVITLEKLLETVVGGQRSKIRQNPLVLRVFFVGLRVAISVVRFVLQNPKLTFLIVGALLLLLLFVVVY